MVAETSKAHARAYLCGPESDPDELKRTLGTPSGGRLVQATRPGHERNPVFFEMLAAQTFQAESSGSLLAKRPEIDFLLRVAGTTQISEAIKRRGAVKGKPFLLVIAGRRRTRAGKGLESVELPRTGLTRGELARIEQAALLNARRP